MSDQSPQQQPYHDDEIDLRKLFKAFGNFIISLGHGLINIILAFRRATNNYKYLLITAIILGVISGLLFNRFTKPYYQTSLLLKSGYLNTKLVENSIDKLNLLCEEKKHQGLAKVLNISIEVADNIVEFKFEPFMDENDIIQIELLKQRLEELDIEKVDINKIAQQIEVKNRNTFLITVQVFDTDIIENLQDALIDYFKNNPFVANRIKTNRIRQEHLIAKLSTDVALLDTLKEAYNLSLKLQALKPNDASTSVILAESGTVDPVRVYSQGVTLFEKLLETERNYALGSDFEVVDGFTILSKPESPGLLKSAAMVAGIFLAFAYLLIILIEINGYLNKIEEQGFKNND